MKIESFRFIYNLQKQLYWIENKKEEECVAKEEIPFTWDRDKPTGGKGNAGNLFLD